MVVLDSGNNSVMSANSGNQYLSPDYLPPLPSTLDAKNSPLALLAQTCSQIGADTSNSKSLLSSLERSKKPSSASSNSSSTNNDRSPSVNGISKSSSSASSASSMHSTENKSPEHKLAFKPYELNVLTRKSDSATSTRPPSGSIEFSSLEERKSTSRASSRKSASSSPHPIMTTSISSPNEKSTSPAGGGAADSAKSVTPSAGDTAVGPTGLKSATPNDLYSSLKDATGSSFKPPFSFSPLASYGAGCNGCPTTTGAAAALPLDPTNPAFRNAFANGAHLAHPSLLDAAACFQSSSPSPYVSYTRVKTPTGTEALVPMCKDPYCFSCRFALHGTMGPCPPGCVQCEQKYSAAAAAAMLMSSHPFSGYQYGRPYVCNWIAGESYCGKRFRNSDELLQHLKTHTNCSDPIALMNHLRYPPGGVNPLAAAAAASAASRYHPYSKPGLPASLAASPFSAFNPTLSPYYPPYSLYDQRIGAAVNP